MMQLNKFRLLQYVYIEITSVFDNVYTVNIMQIYAKLNGQSFDINL